MEAWVLRRRRRRAGLVVTSTCRDGCRRGCSAARFRLAGGCSPPRSSRGIRSGAGRRRARGWRRWCRACPCVRAPALWTRAPSVSSPTGEGEPGQDASCRRFVHGQQRHLGVLAPAWPARAACVGCWRGRRCRGAAPCLQRLRCDLRVEAQAWAWPVAERDRAELVCVFVDPCAGDPELAGELVGVDEAGGRLARPLRDPGARGAGAARRAGRSARSPRV